MEEEKSYPLRGLTEQTVEIVEQVLRDKKQFRRHFVKGKDADQEERVYKKVDTKALKEFISALRELKELLGEEERSGDIRVIFEAGEEAFNE